MQSYTDVLENRMADNEYKDIVEDSFFTQPNPINTTPSKLSVENLRRFSKPSESIDEETDAKSVLSTSSGKSLADDQSDIGEDPFKPKFKIPNLELLTTKSNSNDSLARKIERTKIKLAQLQNQQNTIEKYNELSDKLGRLEGSEDFLPVPEPVGPSVEVEQSRAVGWLQRIRSVVWSSEGESPRKKTRLQ